MLGEDSRISHGSGSPRASREFWAGTGVVRWPPHSLHPTVSPSSTHSLPLPSLTPLHEQPSPSFPRWRGLCPIHSAPASGSAVLSIVSPARFQCLGDLPNGGMPSGVVTGAWRARGRCSAHVKSGGSSCWLGRALLLSQHQYGGLSEVGGQRAVSTHLPASRCPCAPSPLEGHWGPFPPPGHVQLQGRG